MHPFPFYGAETTDWNDDDVLAYALRFAAPLARDQVDALASAATVVEQLSVSIAASGWVALIAEGDIRDRSAQLRALVEAWHAIAPLAIAVNLTTTVLDDPWSADSLARKPRPAVPARIGDVDCAPPWGAVEVAAAERLDVELTTAFAHALAAARERELHAAWQAAAAAGAPSFAPADDHPRLDVARALPEIGKVLERSRAGFVRDGCLVWYDASPVVGAPDAEHYILGFANSVMLVAREPETFAVVSTVPVPCERGYLLRDGRLLVACGETGVALVAIARGRIAIACALPPIGAIEEVAESGARLFLRTAGHWVEVIQFEAPLAVRHAALGPARISVEVKKTRERIMLQPIEAPPAGSSIDLAFVPDPTLSLEQIVRRFVVKAATDRVIVLDRTNQTMVELDPGTRAERWRRPLGQLPIDAALLPGGAVAVQLADRLAVFDDRGRALRSPRGLRGTATLAVLDGYLLQLCSSGPGLPHTVIAYTLKGMNDEAASGRLVSLFSLQIPPLAPVMTEGEPLGQSLLSRPPRISVDDDKVIVHLGCNGYELVGVRDLVRSVSR